jgi:enterobactin synthetase component D
MKPASQRCQDAEHFIYDIRELEQIRLPGVALCASFAVTQYSDALYEVLGIAPPANLGRAVNKRKAEFLCGRFLAALALERLGGPQVEIGSGEHRQPLWPATFNGSLSHSNDRAACLLSNDTALALGIDIENMLTDAGAQNIASSVIDDGERALLGAGPMGFGPGLTAVFSAKEALFKALYPRVRNYFDFRAARLCRLDWQPGRMVFELTQDLAACYRQHDRFEIGLMHDAQRVWAYLVHAVS